MKIAYSKEKLSSEIIEMCRRCAEVVRNKSKVDLEEEVDDAYTEAKRKISTENKKLFRTVRQVWENMYVN